MAFERILPYTSGYPHAQTTYTIAVHADCLQWLPQLPENSIHAVVTDPPYGLKEYDQEQLRKRADGTGGNWRIPPAFDGTQRAPLPRFTALNARELDTLRDFYIAWSQEIVRVLYPGGQVFFAGNAYLSQLVFSALVTGGLEFRGEIIRLVRTLRGGDRPKNAEQEFPNVATMPRSCYEPWGLFRKPLGRGMKVSDCLREYGTGGLRRNPDGTPFCDVIASERTPKRERDIANHPSLKPQSFLRQLTYAALPLGQGVILDPFMGSGSTLAAAQAVGVHAIGIEKYPTYYTLAQQAVGILAQLKIPDTAYLEQGRDHQLSLPLFKSDAL